jgi:hypothetical protein
VDYTDPIKPLYVHGKSSFLIGKPSISMGHLYHGYVKEPEGKPINIHTIYSYEIVIR